MELVWYAATFVINSYLLGEDWTRQCYAAPSNSAIVPNALSEGYFNKYLFPRSDVTTRLWIVVA